MAYSPSTEWVNEVRLGNISGFSVVQMQGYAEGLSTTEQTIWGNSSSVSTALIDSASTVKVASLNSTDTNTAGTGARTVDLIGLDASGNVQNETITMNGTTEVTSSNTYSAVNSMQVLTAGSSKKNDGDIWCGNGTFTAGIPDTKYHWMKAGNSRSKTACYTVPTGKKLWLYAPRMMLNDTTKSADIICYCYDGSLYNVLEYYNLSRGHSGIRSYAMSSLPAGTMIYLNSFVNTGTSGLSVVFDFVLEDV